MGSGESAFSPGLNLSVLVLLVLLLVRSFFGGVGIFQSEGVGVQGSILSCLGLVHSGVGGFLLL